MIASVFISYSSHDSEMALRLGQDLKNHGHDVWLDQWRIQVGHSISAEIERGIGGASFVLLLLSPHAVTSSWVEREWRAAYWDEVQAKRAKVLPALVEPCEVPKLLRDKRYAVLYGDYFKGLEQVLQAIEYHCKELLRASFYARVPEIWKNEIHSQKDLREIRNVHWDNFAGLVEALPLAERRRVQELNTKSYLEGYELTVGQLKEALRDLGFYDGTVDGNYGDDIAISLERFQSEFNLRHVDGIFGPLTYTVMAEVANRQGLEGARLTQGLKRTPDGAA